MKFIDNILRYLPSFIYFGYIFLLLSIYFDLQWYLKNDNTIEVIDFVLCLIMLLHALFRFKSYNLFNETSFITIIALAVFHLVYYKIDIPNKDYYTIYIIILGSNLYYYLLTKIIK